MSDSINGQNSDNEEEERPPEPPPATPDVIELGGKPEPPPATSDTIIKMLRTEEKEDEAEEES